jgi:predicted nucleic acid-binding protein
VRIGSETMAESVLVDTNIFIEIFRNRDFDLQDLVDGFDRTVVNTIIYFELVRGEPNKKRYAEREDYLRKYELIHLDVQTCELSIELMRKFKLSNGLDFPDALIASTCIVHNLYFFTKNRKHFEFIPTLKVI